MRFNGFFPPLVTPLLPDGRVDTTSLHRLVTAMKRAGADGVFVLGSTGELAYLTPSQKQEVVGVAVDAAGTLPVIAGAVEFGTLQVIGSATHYVEQGAAAIAATPPLYSATSPDEIAEHYRLIASATGTPVIAYHNPSSTHVDFPVELLGELAIDGTIAALKDSAGDPDRLTNEVSAVPSTFSVLTGAEPTSSRALRAGALGLMPGLGNVIAPSYRAMVDHASAENWAEVDAEQSLQDRLVELYDVGDIPRVGWTSSALGFLKTALSVLGIIEHPTLSRPMRQLSAPAVKTVERVLESIDVGKLTA